METIQQSNQRTKREYWQHHINAGENSGVTQREYCRRNSLALSTFSYWKRKLRQPSEGKPKFYPLTIPAAAPSEDGSGLHLLTNKGRFCIQIEEGFSSSLLKTLVLEVVK